MLGRSSLLRACAAALVGATLSCAPEPATPVAQDLPLYQGDLARLFDDTVSLRLVNPALTDGERQLGLRAAEADLVAGGRLRTINETSRGNHSSFVLVFDCEETLAGRRPEGGISVEIGPNNPSHAMIRAQRSRLLGVPALLFLKWFQEDNEPKLRARVEPDEPSVREAVVSARM